MTREKSNVITCYCCYKEGHINMDCRKRKDLARDEEESKQVSVTESSSYNDDGKMLLSVTKGKSK